MLKILKSLNDAVTWAMQALLVCAMSGMVALIFAQVIYRYILKAPLSWSEELASYLFSLIIFFGGVVLYRSSGHINMSMAVDAIKNRFFKQIVVVLSHLCTVAFLLVMTWYSFPMAQEIMELEVTSPSMEWLNMGWVCMIVPVASAVSLLMMAEVVLNSLRALKEGK